MPISAATLTKAYANGGGGAIGDCSFTDFGAAFIRDEAYDVDDYGPDFVGLVFGRKAVTTPPSGPGAPGGQGEQKTAPPVKCGPNDEQAEVPAGQQCTPKAAVHARPADRSSLFRPVRSARRLRTPSGCPSIAASDRGPKREEQRGHWR
ncbi:hypothetical protein [Mycobacterium sp. ITM-2016-00318]|uniref:hypothetical protein n=1 Tax=Mycobacterium sp. ITM-2016-00318 TaxID=2099693 RepID=UPI000CF8859B|nr:hypothetical protein [Mycobacterium sp. ITM-2016-00318]WNG93908.1 hypothetical protein C6A82_005475 [Mycobacterium sp. ITM-2016-00318]